MAVTEIPDSEGEPFTSSPQVASDGAGDGPVIAAREPPHDALQEVGSTHQASTRNPLTAVISRSERLSCDHQNALLATASSNHIQSANLQSNTPAQEAHSVNSGQSHEHSPAQTSTLPQNVEDGISHTNAAPIEQYVSPLSEPERGDCPTNTQEVNPAGGEERLRSEEGEVGVTIEQENSVVSHPYVLDPSNQQIPTIEQTNEEDARDMQRNSVTSQDTCSRNDSSGNEDLLVCGAFPDGESSRSPLHVHMLNSSQQVPEISQLAQPQEDKTETDNLETRVENDAQTTAQILRNDPALLSAYSIPASHVPEYAANAPSFHTPVSTSVEPVLLGSSSELQENATIPPTRESKSSEESELRLESLPGPDPIEAGSTLEADPDKPPSANEKVGAGTEMTSTVDMDVDTALKKANTQEDLRHPSHLTAATASHSLLSEIRPELEPTNKKPNHHIGSSVDVRSREPLDSTDTESDHTHNSVHLVEPERQSTQLPASTVEHEPAAKTLQEITLAELKAQRAALVASLAALPNIQNLVAEREPADNASETSDSEPTDAEITAAANKLVQGHIKLLHEYNEIKDVGQGLMGLIADQRGVRIVEVQDEFGLESKD